MRRLQIVLFILGIIVQIAAALNMGSDTGEILWNIGVSIWLGDAILILLWPSRKGQ